MTAATVLDVGSPSPTRRRSFSRYWRGNLKGSEFIWALAFSVPYIAVFAGLRRLSRVLRSLDGKRPGLYSDVFSDVIYQDTVVNTLVFVALGVNLKLFLALLLSGVFMRPGWLTKVMLMLFVLPWAVPQLPAFISLHWMLNGEWGLLNNALWILGGIEGPSWLERTLDGAGRGDRLASLEMDAILDRDPAGRPHVDPAGHL